MSVRLSQGSWFCLLEILVSGLHLVGVSWLLSSGHNGGSVGVLYVIK